MFGVKGKITKCIDDESYPGFVEIEFHDASDERKVFHDKIPIFTEEVLDKSSNYPVFGTVACEIINTKIINDRIIVLINTGEPWGVESTTGETIFQVFNEQIIEFENSEDRF